MFRFALRRLLSGGALLFIITTVAYALLYAGGGDIARRIMGPNATQDQVDRRAAELGLDRPLWEQYQTWLGQALTGDLGTSWFSRQPVLTEVTDRLAVTLSLVVGATLLATVAAVALGVLAAVRRGWIDRAVQVLALLGFAVPGFLIALGLVLLLAIELGWFRATGYVPWSHSPGDWLASVTLPVLALSASAVAAVAQQIRGSVIDALDRDYVRTLRSRGLGFRRVVLKHVLRNSAGPALAVLGVQFIGLLGGAVIVEQVFSVPGLGQLSVQATGNGDIPLVLGLVLATAAIVITVNLLIDLCQAALNPKVRLS